jgi:uncharacterized cupin superfamily protein
VRDEYVWPVDEPFIVNMADAPALAHPRRATIIDFEQAAHEGRRRHGTRAAGAAADGGELGPEIFPDTGVNVQILQPGQPNGRYHSEPAQEDFLVLHGECVVILGGEERLMRQWDFLHCPPGVEHIFVGAGDGPCAVLMIGSRRDPRVHYPVNELAAKYDASVAAPTDDPAEAYADWRKEPWRPTPSPWPL